MSFWREFGAYGRRGARGPCSGFVDVDSYGFLQPRSRRKEQLPLFFDEAFQSKPLGNFPNKTLRNTFQGDHSPSVKQHQRPWTDRNDSSSRETRDIEGEGQTSVPTHIQGENQDNSSLTEVKPDHFLLKGAKPKCHCNDCRIIRQQPNESFTELGLNTADDKSITDSATHLEEVEKSAPFKANDISNDLDIDRDSSLQDSNFFDTEDDSDDSTYEEETRLQKLQAIKTVKEEVVNLQERVNLFVDKDKNLEYLTCEELLTKCLLKLDDILTEGIEEVRSTRKALVLQINNTLKQLEEKLNDD